MKYGETLRQRSIPQWSHHNIDYDDIKHYIKEQTTHGKGKSVAIPGQPDEKLKDFENTLFDVLADQHSRIDLFVRSKVGEIQRRLNHAKRQLEQFASKNYATDRRIPVKRMERYSRLENKVMRAGEEIKSVSRFVGAQRTALRKLLKKYKKWTGSRELEDRFGADVLADPNGFTSLDLGPLLSDYSDTLIRIRSLYENGMKQPAATQTNGPDAGPSSIAAELESEIASGSRKRFDAVFSKAPTGERSTLTTYLVHPDNIVELRVLLLEHTQHLTASRKDSTSLHGKDRKDTASDNYCERNVTCSRSRLVGLNNSTKDVLLTTLDENLHNDSFKFPFAVLRIRHEGKFPPALTEMLDKSHLVERVQDFPVQYETVFEACQSEDPNKPAWYSRLSQDIRKLPPALTSGSHIIAQQTPQAFSPGQASTPSGSTTGFTGGSTTAAEDSRPYNSFVEFNEAPSRSSLRKDRKRSYRARKFIEPSPVYWNEYDHPEDGEDGDAYVIYIDPNEKSLMDKMIEKLRHAFSRRRAAEEESLLGDGATNTPTVDESSSDEEAITHQGGRHIQTYGSLNRSHSEFLFRHKTPPSRKQRYPPQLTAICMVAAVAILVVAYILAATGRHKYIREVDGGVIFAITTSLIFAITGVASIFGKSNLSWTVWAISIGILIVDAIVVVPSPLKTE